MPIHAIAIKFRSTHFAKFSVAFRRIDLFDTENYYCTHDKLHSRSTLAHTIQHKTKHIRSIVHVFEPHFQCRRIGESVKCVLPSSSVSDTSYIRVWFRGFAVYVFVCVWECCLFGQYQHKCHSPNIGFHARFFLRTRNEQIYSRNATVKFTSKLKHEITEFYLKINSLHITSHFPSRFFFWLWRLLENGTVDCGRFLW